MVFSVAERAAIQATINEIHAHVSAIMEAASDATSALRIDEHDDAILGESVRPMVADAKSRAAIAATLLAELLT